RRLGRRHDGGAAGREPPGRGRSADHGDRGRQRLRVRHPDPVAKLATPGGDDRLRFRGRLDLPFPFSPPLDPTMKGVRILLDDSTGGRVLDATIPGGGYDDATQTATQTGWKMNASHTKWTYTNGLGGIRGIVRVTVRASSSVPGQVDFSVTGRNGAYPVPRSNIPVTATFALDSLAGQCGAAWFSGLPPETG